MFTKNVVTTLGMLLLALQSYAQFHFSGTVLDRQTQQPIAGATIRLQARGTHGAQSDKAGHFVIDHLQAATYQLTISFVGYGTFRKEIKLDTDVEDYTIALSQENLFVKPVEITSLRAGKEAPFAKSDINKSDLEKVNLGQDLPILLKQQPSVVTTSDAGAGVGYTGIRVRGTDVARTNVTLNGIPVNDAESQGAFFVDLPDLASSVNSIQLQRGVGSSTNGAGAFGASLNISTNDFSQDAYADVYSSYGSFNTWKNTVKAGSGLLNNHFTTDIRLSQVSSDGYIDRASSNLKSLYFSTAYLTDKSSLRFNLITGKEKTYQAWDGVPEDSLKTNRTYNELGQKSDGTFYNDQTDNYQQDYYQLFFNHEISSRLNFNIAAFLTRGKGYYQEYEQDEAYEDYGVPDVVIGDSTVTQTDLTQQLWLDNYYYGGIFSVNYEGKKLQSSLGGGWNRYDGKHYGIVLWAQSGGFDDDYKWYNNEAHKWDFNIYWKGQYDLSNALSAFLDLQYRKVKYDINGFDDNPELIQHNNYDFFNPKAGLVYHLDANDRLYASYAVAHKEPNRDDFEAGKNEAPKAETLHDIEAGYVHEASLFTWSLNAFYMDYKNQLVLTGQINDVGAQTRTNIPDSYRAGIEGSTEVKFAKIFSFKANATYSRNKVKDFKEYVDDYDNGGQQVNQYSQTDIAFSPDWTGAFTLSVHPGSRFEIALDGKYVSKQYLDNTGDRQYRDHASSVSRTLDAYYVNDLQLHYALPLKSIRTLELSLLVNNLLNVKYEPNGYTYSYIEDQQTKTFNYMFPQAGINFLFGVHIGF